MVESARSTDHNHARCIEHVLADADRICAEEGGRLTPLRRQVLALVWRGHDAVKAYELLDLLSAEHAAAKPATVYRALQFLLAKGLVHRLESLNAFIGCDRPSRRHAGHFLICDGCGRISEMASAGLDRLIAREAGDAGFTVHRSMVEVRGLCPGCREASGAAATGPFPPEQRL